MNNLIEIDLLQCKGKKPILSPVTDGAWIARGSIRKWFTGESIKYSDIDVFFRNEECMKNYIEMQKFSHKVGETKNSIDYLKDGVKCQMIKIFNETPFEVVNRFDFKHCQFICFEEGKIHATSDAIICALRQSLMIGSIRPGYELDTLRRAFKYHKQGYTPCIGTLKLLGESFKDITQEVLEEQLTISPGGGQRVVRFD